jgi:hypothetical protein
MSAIATISVLGEASPSLGSSVVNGLLAWAVVLGVCLAFYSIVPAAVAVFIPGRPEPLSRRVDRWLAVGFLVGMPLGFLMFVVFVARVVS